MRVVEFTKDIIFWEEYAMPGMRAKVVSEEECQDDGEGDEWEDGPTTLVKLDFSEFESYNAQFESRNYYDNEGSPRLTAREAGCYEPVQVYVVSGYRYPFKDGCMTTTEVLEGLCQKAVELTGPICQWPTGLRARVLGAWKPFPDKDPPVGDLISVALDFTPFRAYNLRFSGKCPSSPVCTVVIEGEALPFRGVP